VAVAKGRGKCSRSRRFDQAPRLAGRWADVAWRSKRILATSPTFDAMVGTVAGESGGIDVVVNNAGVTRHGALLEIRDNVGPHAADQRQGNVLLHPGRIRSLTKVTAGGYRERGGARRVVLCMLI
jgi:NAD(P)-dependent dehydrogenase (short-subunit alcohol dehydrogenase family)